MEFRKLISFGNSSFVVSLPKSWVEKNKLVKGDMIYIEEKNDELALYTNNKTIDEAQKEITIDVSNKKADSINREIVYAYINNYDIIHVVGNDLRAKMSEIRNFLHRLVALEIMEQTQDKLVAKTFLNINDISMNEIVRRADVIIRAKMSEFESKLKSERYNLEFDEKDLDVDVTRLYFLLLRVARNGLSDARVLKILNATPLQLSNYIVLMDNLQRIADHNKKIGRLMDGLQPKQLAGEVAQIYSHVFEHYVGAMRAFFSRNRKLADEVANKIKIAQAEYDQSMHKYSKPGLANIFEKLKNMERQIHGIVKIVLDEPVDVN